MIVNNFNVILYDISKGQNSSQAKKYQVETSQLKILPAKSNKMTSENVESCKNRGSNYNLTICVNIWSNDTFVVQSATKTTDK